MKRIRLIRYVWYVGYLALLLCASRVTAQTHTIRQFEAQRRAALREIEQTTQLLNEARASAQTSLNRLHLISQQVIARKKVISLLNQEIAVLDKQIADATRELAVLEKSLNDRKERYAQLVRNLYTRRASQHRLLFVLSADNFAQSLRRMRYLREYASWQKMQALLIVRKQEELDKKREELGQTRTDKVALLDAREEESRKLQQEESEQKAEVQQLNKKEKNLRQKLAQKRRQAEALNRQIERLIAEEVKRSGKASSGKRKAESNGGYAMTKAERKLSADFASNRGRLPFPLNGKYRIISTFGEHQHQALRHVRTNNNGIDIQTTSGTEARAVFDGVVTRVFVVPGYNNSVIVRHGNYLTVYSNLSHVYVKAGDNVTTRQSIGKIYTDTENNNETVLHFQLWKEKRKLDPELWLD